MKQSIKIPAILLALLVGCIIGCGNERPTAETAPQNTANQQADRQSPTSPSATGKSSEMPTDPIGGQPPARSKPSVKDLDYQVKYQRAFEAVIWGIPHRCHLWI